MPLEVYLIVLRTQPPVELFQKPLIVPNPKFPEGSKAWEENKLYTYTFMDRERFHEAIDYLIDNGIRPNDIRW